MSEASSVDFVMLLSLSENGRDHPLDAIGSLNSMSDVASGELGGAIDKWTLTHGHYDAVVMGHFPDVESVSSFVGWVQDKNYFVSQTLIGASADAFAYLGRGYTHS